MKNIKPVLGVLILGLFVYEGVALNNAAPGDTISEVVWEGSAKYPIIILGFGLLMGHFFWPKK